MGASEWLFTGMNSDVLLKLILVFKLLIAGDFLSIYFDLEVTNKVKRLLLMKILDVNRSLRIGTKQDPTKLTAVRSPPHVRIFMILQRLGRSAESAANFWFIRQIIVPY